MREALGFAFGSPPAYDSLPYPVLRIRLAGHSMRVNQWLDQYPITDHREAAAVYFLMLLLDLGGFDFE